ncbi:hypothetical protein [Sphingomonas sp.]|uniref:hypothetical protein n=1 Tax=Sphingomonas sp. TaxID=28214 RepID=UPI000DB6472D|nr:hypothetical protein [Sphingomonas sp.]PZU08518.1 MAG: hypothetical protein DI605_11110 [Sphingomonas sp.]
MDATIPSAPTRSGKVANIIQWTVCALMAVSALTLSAGVGKLNSPGAPAVYLYICIAIAVIAALIYAPMTFKRLPRTAKWGAYIALIPMLALFGDCTAAVDAAWHQTPEGAKEAAAKAKVEALAAAEKARKQALEDARAKAELAQAAETAAAERQADIQTQAQNLCDSLVPNVIALSKDGIGPEVIEINEIAVGYTGDANQLNCTGLAVVSRGGDRRIDFGARRTPQGKSLVTMQLR